MDRSTNSLSMMWRELRRVAGLALVAGALGGCGHFYDSMTAKSPEGDMGSNVLFKFKMLMDRRDPLVVLAESQDGDLRRRAYLQVELDGDAQRKETVAALLIEGAKTEKDTICRLAAIERLPELKDPRATQALVDAFYAPNNFGDKNPVVRVAAVNSLARTNDQLAHKTLSEALARDPSIEVRIAAAKGLGGVPNAQATQALVRVLREEKDVNLRFHATTSLQQITGKDLPASAPEWEQYLQTRPASPDGNITREPGNLLRQANWWQR